VTCKATAPRCGAPFAVPGPAARRVPAHCVPSSWQLAWHRLSRKLPRKTGHRPQAAAPDTRDLI